MFWGISSKFLQKQFFKQLLLYAPSFADWLVKKTIQKIVLVVTSVAKKEDIERWQFNIECDKSANETTYVYIIIYNIRLSVSLCKKTIKYNVLW